jgi:hypothetical protein
MRSNRLFFALIVMILCGSGASYAQQDYYYSDNRRIYFTKSDNWIVVQIHERDRVELAQRLEQIPQLRIKQVLKPGRGIYWLETSRGDSDWCCTCPAPTGSWGSPICSCILCRRS